MPEKITILKESGETLVSNIVSIFMIPETEKRYIITTENAVDPHGLTVLHVSEIVDGNMQKIATDDEWSSIKTIMRAIISGNVGSYKYLPVINNLNAVSQYSRDISVSASASKQMIDNYNAGDKSAVNIDANAGATETLQQPGVGEAPVVAQAPINPSTIFPTDGTVVSNDDELVPGIAELPPVQAPVAGPSPVPVASPPIQGQVAGSAVAPVLSEAQNVPSSMPAANVVAPQEPVVDAISVPVLGVGSNIPTAPVLTPVAPIPTGEALVANVAAPVAGTNPAGDLTSPPIVNPEVAAVNVAVTPVIDAQVNPPVGMGMVATNPEPQPVVANNLGLTNDVQVATPTTVIPDAQIVQNAQNTSLTTDEQINFNATPSFDPNATLDEVVVAAQQMFMEGVKNLVVTIQEKVYRDLYSKEEELKNREAAIAQKEQSLGISGQPVGIGVDNQQVTNVSSTPVAPMTPVSPQPVAVQPTLVQASNDVI